MVFVDSTGQTHNGSSGILIPVRCAQSRKCRNHIAAVGIFYFLSHILGVCCGINHPQFIAQPLYRSSSHKNGSFQCIINFPIDSPGDGCNQPIFRKYRLFSGVHQQKTTGSIGVFCISRCKTGLSEQCRLLVSCRSTDGNLSSKKCRIRTAVYTA